MKITDVDVKITKAEVRKIAFTFKEDDLPEIDVDVYLMTNSGEVLSYLSMSTTHYKPQLKLESIPTSVYKAAGDCFKAVRAEVRDKINGIQKTITAEVS